jgi:hypothetical protein
MASVTDIKNLVQEGDGVNPKSVLVQTLTITNDGNGKHCTTTRHFNPHVDVPQHVLLLSGAGGAEAGADSAMKV